MNKKGFTLIELLIVVAIIGIIAAIAIPNLLVALQKGKQKATMGDLKSIGTGIESYITDWAFAPVSNPITTGAALAGVPGFFEPFYIKVAPKKDGWGCVWGYAPGAGFSDVYSLWSSGRDGSKIATTALVPPTPNTLYVCTQLSDFGWDICFSNGQFVYGPDTKK